MSLTVYPTRRRRVNPRPQRHPLRRIVEERMEQQRFEREERHEAIRRGTETIPTSHWVIARLNAIQHLGRLDRSPDGPGYRMYRIAVGSLPSVEVMTAQISEHDGDLCITFWGKDNRSRRLLVTAAGDLWIEVRTKDAVTGHAIKGIRHTGKYARAWITDLSRQRAGFTGLSTAACEEEAHG